MKVKIFSWFFCDSLKYGHMHILWSYVPCVKETKALVHVMRKWHWVSYIIQSANCSYFPWYSTTYSKVVSGCSAWTDSSPYQISSHSVEKCARKWRNRHCLVLTLWPPTKVMVTESGIKWSISMVTISMASIQKFGKTRLHAMSNVKDFAMKDGWTDGQRLARWTQLITQIHTLLKWKKKKKKKNREEQFFRKSVFTIHAGFFSSHLFDIINHCDCFGLLHATI